jgi:lysophospholipase L1-like esterase
MTDYGDSGLSARPLSRFVAIGDSFTEGLDDLLTDGTPRGWADRVADVLATTEPEFRYANLAVRSLRIDAIVDQQVPAAIAMRPDLVTLAAGGNDVISFRVDLDAVAARFDEAVACLTAAGAVTVVFTGFDPRSQLPPGRFIAARTEEYNRRIIAIAETYDAILVDLWSMPELWNLRMWSPDRLHLSPLGHLHIAGFVLYLLDRPVPAGWPIDLDEPAHRSRLRARAGDLAWGRQHLLPWVVRRARGRSTGDGRSAKRPALAPWRPAASSVVPIP